MKEKGQIKRLFPGGNTSQGFYSYYHHVIQPQQAKRVFLLKGGPGVGKSHLMKTIGHWLVDQGYDIEFHHCSADPESLDAVVSPALKIAFIDGTAPHVIDPKYPGAVETLIPLGEHWNEPGLEAVREEIVRHTDENGKLYKRVYKYLEAAKLITEDQEWIYQEAFDPKKAEMPIRNFIQRIHQEVKESERLGQERHLFGSAYTFMGHIHHADTFIQPMGKQFVLQGSSLQLKSKILGRIAQGLIESGVDVEYYHHPMVPQWIEALVVPQYDLAVSSHQFGKPVALLNLEDYMDATVLAHYQQELKTAAEFATKLLEQVYENLKKTKKNHDKIEAFYHPHVHFNTIDQLTADLQEKLLEIAKG